MAKAHCSGHSGKVQTETPFLSGKVYLSVSVGFTGAASKAR